MIANPSNLGNFMIAGNYVIANPSNLGNFMIADRRSNPTRDAAVMAQ